MKCPLFYMAFLQQGGFPGGDEDDCLKEECAWWDKVPKRCLVFSVRAELYILNELLQKRWEGK